MCCQFLAMQNSFSFLHSWILGAVEIQVPYSSLHVGVGVFSGKLSLYRDATGTVKKSRKLSLERGSGGRAPSGVQVPWTALVGVQGGEAPLKLELFLNQNCPESHQLTRMVVTHVYNTCTGERKKEKKKRRKKVGKSEGLKKSEFRQKSEKRHPCL